MKLTILDHDPQTPISISSAALDLAGLGEIQALSLYAQSKTAVLIPAKMTVLELADVCQGLEELVTDLLSVLAEACGPCVECRDTCAMADYQGGPLVRVPEEALREAGLSPDQKLCCTGNEDANVVLVEAASHKHDLSDLPYQIRDMLHSAGVCMDQLNDYIAEDAVVYGVE